MIISQRKESKPMPTERRADRDVNGSMCERELSAERDKTWHECCGLAAVHQNHLDKVIAVSALLSFLTAPWLADCDVADPQTITWKRLLPFTI